MAEVTQDIVPAALAGKAAESARRGAHSARDGQAHAFAIEDSRNRCWPQAMSDPQFGANCARLGVDDPDPAALRRVTLADAGHAQNAQLRGTLPRRECRHGRSSGDRQPSLCRPGAMRLLPGQRRLRRPRRQRRTRRRTAPPHPLPPGLPRRCALMSTTLPNPMIGSFSVLRPATKAETRPRSKAPFSPPNNKVAERATSSPNGRTRIRSQSITPTILPARQITFRCWKFPWVQPNGPSGTSPVGRHASSTAEGKATGGLLGLPGATVTQPGRRDPPVQPSGRVSGSDAPRLRSGVFVSEICDRI